MQTEHLHIKKLLEYAEKIGGEKMYFGMRRALREAGVFHVPELNQKQLRSTLRKLVGSGEYSMNREKLETMIDEHERKRKAFIHMAIEKDIEMEEQEHPGAYSAYSRIGAGGGKKRYEFQGDTKTGSVSASDARGSATSVFHTKDKPSISASVNRPKDSAGSAPVTSISKINRPPKSRR